LLLVLPFAAVAERGMLYQKLKDYRKAVKEFAKAAKADPKNPQVWSELPCAVLLAAPIVLGFGTTVIHVVPSSPAWWIHRCD
jgi:tetratricopeptide (TPR) repeat protein